MKSATLPSLRVEPELRKAVEERQLAEEGMNGEIDAWPEY